MAQALERIKSLVLDSVRSPHTRRAYDRVLSEFLAWCLATGAEGFTKATVQSYRSDLEARGLSASAVNVQLAAIRKLATEAADNGMLAPELVTGLAKVPGATSEGTSGRELAHPGTSQHGHCDNEAVEVPRVLASVPVAQTDSRLQGL
jgi:hypothetical protein